MARNLAALLRLMLVTDDRFLAGRDLLTLCSAAVRGGVTCVQLRLKHATPREYVAAARALVGSLSVPVLVNDRLDVALAAGAAGVHLGPDDLPVALARKAVPPGFLIGGSVGGPAEAATVGAADYWGAGPWRTTTTKPDAGREIGLAGFGEIVALAGRIPCVAIGGIRPEDVAIVRALGGAGVAVVSGILDSTEVEPAARRYAASPE